MRRRIRQQTERREKWIFVGFSLHASKRGDLFSVWKMDNSEVGEKKGKRTTFSCPYLTPRPPPPLPRLIQRKSGPLAVSDYSCEAN